MVVSDFYTARWPDFICISAHYKYVMMMMMMMSRKLVTQAFISEVIM